jgi:hypothetical protein
MELIVIVLIGSLIGSFIVIIMCKLLNPNPSTSYQELIKQSKEQLETVKKLSEELDKLLEDK